ncbi:MAG: hypothetical protein IPJ73_11040 [Zoogloea sp.]|nr:hypothetical protein [Zoogloea sp.]
MLDPVVAMVSLAGCVLLLDPRGGPHYILLAVMAFGLLFPGNAGFHEQPRRVIRKIGTNWLLLVAVLGGFGIASGYARHFPRTVVWTWVVFAPLAMVAAHFMARVVVLRALTATTRQRTAIVAGVNDVGLSLARQFKQNPLSGLPRGGFFDDRNLERLPDTDGLPTLGTMAEAVWLC